VTFAAAASDRMKRISAGLLNVCDGGEIEGSKKIRFTVRVISYPHYPFFMRSLTLMKFIREEMPIV
jgi:hypothetical protein